MKGIFLFLLSALISVPSWASMNLDPLLNKITFQLQAQEWVTTTTALVNVRINAAVSNQGIEEIQTNVMNKLKQISDKSPWHLVSFDRQLDKSELENIQILAEARLPQTELANLRTKAKALSKPGDTYTIEGVQFTPSDEELKQANSNLRNNLYQQAKVELANLNKLYPDQKFYVHQIDFVNASPMPMAYGQANLMLARSDAGALPKAAPMAVGNKQELFATVTLAAMPTELAQQAFNPKPLA